MLAILYPLTPCLYPKIFQNLNLTSKKLLSFTLFYLILITEKEVKVSCYFKNTEANNKVAKIIEMCPMQKMQPFKILFFNILFAFDVCISSLANS